jgi:hypothetical protein
MTQKRLRGEDQCGGYYRGKSPIGEDPNRTAMLEMQRVRIERELQEQRENKSVKCSCGQETTR